jgi:hypothetical protein
MAAIPGSYSVLPPVCATGVERTSRSIQSRRHLQVVGTMMPEFSVDERIACSGCVLDPLRGVLVRPDGEAWRAKENLSDGRPHSGKTVSGDMSENLSL